MLKERKICRITRTIVNGKLGLEVQIEGMRVKSDVPSKTYKGFKDAGYTFQMTTYSDKDGNLVRKGLACSENLCYFYKNFGDDEEARDEAIAALLKKPTVKGLKVNKKNKVVETRRMRGLTVETKPEKKTAKKSKKAEPEIISIDGYDIPKEVLVKMLIKAGLC